MVHKVKIARAKQLATIGPCHASFEAVIDAVPEATIAAISSRALAELADAIWRSWGETKAIAERDAIAEGGIWDARRETFRALAN